MRERTETEDGRADSARKYNYNPSKDTEFIVHQKTKSSPLCAYAHWCRVKFERRSKAPAIRGCFGQTKLIDPLPVVTVIVSFVLSGEKNRNIGHTQPYGSRTRSLGSGGTIALENPTNKRTGKSRVRTWKRRKSNGRMATNGYRLS